MVLDKMEIRVLIRYCWKRKLSTRDTAAEINGAKGETIVNQSTVSRWFKRFAADDINLVDKTRSGCPCVMKGENLHASLGKEPMSSTRDLAKNLGVSQGTILNYLHKFDYVNKKPRQDPHELTEFQATRRVEICRQLLENPLDDRFLEQDSHMRRKVGFPS